MHGASPERHGVEGRKPRAALGGGPARGDPSGRADLALGLPWGFSSIPPR